MTLASVLNKLCMTRGYTLSDMRVTFFDGNEVTDINAAIDTLPMHLIRFTPKGTTILRLLHRSG